jgi:hypothetical protein
MNVSDSALDLVKNVMALGFDGIGPLDSAAELASDYARDSSFADTSDRVDSVIRWETSKNVTTGFLTGLGGLLALPVTVPASLGAAWVVQARLVGTIAILGGYDLDDDRVRTMAMLCVVGDGAKEVAKGVGIDLGRRLALKGIDRIPGKLLIEINKKIGIRLLTKAGEKGVINLVQLVPIVGGAIGGTVDGIACYSVGQAAKSAFVDG